MSIELNLPPKSAETTKQAALFAEMGLFKTLFKVKRSAPTLDQSWNDPSSCNPYSGCRFSSSARQSKTILPTHVIQPRFKCHQSKNCTCLAVLPPGRELGSQPSKRPLPGLSLFNFPPFSKQHLQAHVLYPLRSGSAPSGLRTKHWTHLDGISTPIRSVPTSLCLYLPV